MNRDRERLGFSMSLPTVLTVVFMILKLTGAITWRWIWVLSPIWISVALAVLFMFVIVLVEAIRRTKK